jgi:hypothetical protein
MFFKSSVEERIAQIGMYFTLVDWEEALQVIL